MTVKKGLLRFSKHFLFSLAGTVTDTFVLWICSRFLFNGYALENILSPFISFECANIVNFLLASKFVFGDRNENLPFKILLARFFEYNLSYSTTFFIKMGLLLGIQAITKWDVVICNLMALCFTGILNYFLNDKVIFRKKKTSK